MAYLGPSLRRAKVRERPGRRIAIAVLASLLVNLAMLLAMVRAGAFQAASPRQVRPVTLAPLSPSDWASNRAIAGAPAERKPATPFAMPRTPAAPPPSPPESKAAEKGQVVDLGRTNDQKPKDSRFLSEHDSSVEKETRSRHAKAGYERPLPTPSAPGPKAAPPPGQDGKSDRSVPGLEGPPAESRAAEQKVAAAPRTEGELPGAAAPAPREGGAPAPAPAPGVAGEGGERRAGAASESSLIAPGTLARIAGGPAPDHLEGVEEGEGTFLNAKGWKYATYFNRIKQAVAAAWDPVSPLDARDPDRSMFGYKDRFTLLGVTLDDTGRLKSLVVEQTSGVEFLDRAAMTAFRTAQPFMNPPRGIVDDRGEIKFSFGFFLEVGHTGMRIFRAPR